MIATQKSRGIWEGEEINLTLGISLSYGRSERGWAHLGRERSPSLAGRAGGKESAPLGWENFEKLIFHPVTENPERICVCSPGFVSPMRGRTWLGAVLVLGAQLRGKKTFPGRPHFSLLIPKILPQAEVFPPSLLRFFLYGISWKWHGAVEFLPQQV